MRLTRAALVAALFAGAASCHSSPTAVICEALPVAYLRAIPPFDTIAVGDSVRFRVPAAVLSLSPKPLIRWSSGNAIVATVSPDSGVAHALSVGGASIDGVDQNTVGMCYPAAWHGTLVVRA